MLYWIELGMVTANAVSILYQLVYLPIPYITRYTFLRRHTSAGYREENFCKLLLASKWLTPDGLQMIKSIFEYRGYLYGTSVCNEIVNILYDEAVEDTKFSTVS